MIETFTFLLFNFYFVLCALRVSALKIVADPSQPQPSTLGLIRPAAENNLSLIRLSLEHWG